MLRGDVRMAKVTRQVRLDPELEVKIQAIADRDGRTFSNCVNWLLGKAVADLEADTPSEENH